MKILVTGGLGLVGRSVISQLISRGHSVRLFDRPASGYVRRILRSASEPLRSVVRRVLRRHHGETKLEIVRGDLCNIADVGEAVRGVDAVIHLGALIPPAADRHPQYAHYVNEGGTTNIVAAMKEHIPNAVLVYTSSVAIYGDRLANPMIRISDAPNPNDDDCYAQQKLAAESVVRGSGLRYVICRLAAIMSHEKLQLDPLLFEMPPATSLEICTATDTARALANAVESREAESKILHIAGGAACRTTYGEFLDRTFEVLGLGRGFLPATAFRRSGFHCGYMDTEESQAILQFQHDTLEDYYSVVAHAVRWRRPIFTLLRPVIRSVLLNRSHYWRETVRPRRRDRFGSSVAGRKAHLQV
jgi:nucleoside-diphosphate-sugar epimerase